MEGYTEIPLSEVLPYATGFREALQAVCESPAFKTSPKSCEFLRHIVHRALNGDTDELKERLIGMSLLGREATYDTGSDAGVRVRANDVRKRLTTYNRATTKVGSFSFDLPSGSYVPRFFRKTTSPFNVGDSISGRPEQNETQVPLTLQQLATPTAIAFFLCIVCLRWQIGREHPFMTFWQNIFQRHSVTLYLPPTQDNLDHQLVSLSQVQATAPLLSLAGEFSGVLDLTENAAAQKGNTLISIGAAPESKADRKLVQAPEGYVAQPNTGHLEIINTVDGRRLFDRTAAKIYPASAGTALLTISNDAIRSIRIEGTDDASVASLIRLLCTRDTFPEGLADDLSHSGTTQVVFPMLPPSQPIFFRDSLRSPERAPEKTQ